ncbi:MAG: hypothetical protein PHT80_06645 [Lentisphaeria bacterium]|nr:hypothetical protein [Lentisphaeria bacterium]
MNHKRDVKFMKTLADPALRMRAIRRWQFYRFILKYTAVLLIAASLALAIVDYHSAATAAVLLAAVINIVLLISIDLKIKLAYVEDRPPY